MLIKLLFSDARAFFAIVLIITFSICLHELAHAWVALKCGDDTAARNGHLTLNPLKQMGLFSFFMLLVIGIAWGQVPVDESRMRGKFAPALVAASGPVTNILLFLALTLINLLTARHFGDIRFANIMLSYGAVINLVLAFFNLLPIPGLDGWHIVRTFWKPRNQEPTEFVKGAYLLMIMMLFVFADKIFSLAQLVYRHTIIFFAETFFL